jgi:hypothetical protein
MPRNTTLGKIEKDLERLTTQDQLKLLERLAHQLRTKRRTMKKELNWGELYGLGKGLWKGEDAQEYVNRVREDRI